jgi:hypothetical protein
MKVAGISFLFLVFLVYFHSDFKVLCLNLIVDRRFSLQKKSILFSVIFVLFSIQVMQNMS